MVTITNITETEALISWNIPYFTAPEVYTVEYGLTSALDRVSSTVQSITDTSINFQPYDVMLQGLNTGTRYYFRVVARFGTDNIYVRSSDLFSFFTQFERKYTFVMKQVIFFIKFLPLQHKLHTFHSWSIIVLVSVMMCYCPVTIAVL